MPDQKPDTTQIPDGAVEIRGAAAETLMFATTAALAAPQAIESAINVHDRLTGSNQPAPPPAAQQPQAQATPVHNDSNVSFDFPKA